MPDGYVNAIERWWWAILGAFTLAVEASVIVPRALRGTRPPATDGMLFQYVGWYISHGGVLYRDVFEVKPPLAYYLPAALASVTGGDVQALYVLTMVASAVAVVATVLFVGRLVELLTGDRIAALAAGFVVFAMPFTYTHIAQGMKAKPFVLAFGLGALLLVHRERFVAAGAAAAAAAGFWQLGVVFPAVVLAAGFRRGRESGRRALAGAVVVTVLTVAPVVLAGGGRAMIAEVVFAPLVGTESRGVASRITGLVSRFGIRTAILFAGVVGAVFAWWLDSRTDATASVPSLWLTAGMLWFGGSLLLVDFDGRGDIYVPLVFCALGYGVVAAWRPALRLPLAGVAVGTAVAMFYLEGIHVPAGTPLEAYAPNTLAGYYRVPRPPESCHVAWSPTERAFVRAIGGSPYDDVCGDYSLRELLRAVS